MPRDQRQRDKKGGYVKRDERKRNITERAEQI